MPEWINVFKENALMNGQNSVIDVDGTDVAIFKINNEYFAIEDVCSHDGTEIASGMLDGDEIICPRHGARFCIKTGVVKSAPAYEDIHSYPIRIVEGMVQIKDNR
ncbi:MAG: non-heme iron oxygenase ferredoxin subunit [Methylococcales bacterium]|jgi:3-phenylpropionate/trans-cinnamate dioxygenase ferredoxin subunit|nr:MAG: non-heme iron oxygenase ferredoxin subunit [Methylococcales bacterium]